MCYSLSRPSSTDWIKGRSPTLIDTSAHRKNEGPSNLHPGTAGDDSSKSHQCTSVMAGYKQEVRKGTVLGAVSIARALIPISGPSTSSALPQTDSQHPLGLICRAASTASVRTRAYTTSATPVAYLTHGQPCTAPDR